MYHLLSYTEITNDILLVQFLISMFYKVCFEVFYLTGDGYISREKIFDMLKNSLSQQSPEEENEEGIRELVEISLKKMVSTGMAKHCIQASSCAEAWRERWLFLHSESLPYGQFSHDLPHGKWVLCTYGMVW